MVLFLMEINQTHPAAVVAYPGRQVTLSVERHPIGHMRHELRHALVHALLTQRATKRKQSHHPPPGDALDEQLVGRVEKGQVSRCTRQVHLDAHFIEHLKSKKLQGKVVLLGN